MTFDEIYARAKNYLESKDLSGFGAGVYSYEFDVTGSGAGRFYVELRDGELSVQPFDYKNSLCTLTLSSDSLTGIIGRSVNPTDAYSTGRLGIKGDVSAAFRLADALEIAV